MTNRNASDQRTLLHPTTSGLAGTPSKPDLWRRIEAFQIDRTAGGPPQLTFAGRLARENGWTLPHAARIVEEYKRFLYLAMVTTHPVTPSEDVDQAWHLHLAYTQSYWTELCGKVLNRPLHHGPTAGGAAENVKYNNLYGQTLALYEREFGTAPDAALWPAPEVRFGDDLEWTRINTARNWVIPKRAVRRASIAGLGATGLVATLAGCAAVSNQLPPTEIMLSLGLLIVVLFLIGWGVVASANRANHRNVRRRRRRRRRNSGTTADTSGGCSFMPWWFFGMGDTSDTSDGHGHGHGGHHSGSDDSGSNSDSGSNGGGDSGGDGGGGGCSGGGCGGGGCGGGGD